VSGYVQGVFFRANTRWKALSLGLTGWVRNLQDGRVEITAEGPEDAVNRLIDWCHIGPRGARVTSVQVFEEKPRGDFESFDIL
jgi:acylphosphatase